MKDFRWSFVVAFICLAVAGWWGDRTGMGVGNALWLALVLGVLEVSLSFDNAVVNAGVLRDMDAFWRRMFLTIGILVAVFGMRLVFPIVIVAVAAKVPLFSVIQMALGNPAEYSKHLHDAYPAIAAFGSMFLLLVFLNFLFDTARERHWLGGFERKMSQLGKLDSIATMVALCVLFGTRWFVPEAMRYEVLVAGMAGIILYVGVDLIASLFGESEHVDETGAVTVIKRTGVAAFIYLEVLDASFSFDGVIGAFAITRDVVIIMLGLAIGAMFVRSMTIHLVKRGTLNKYVYLEHGAHYAIGVLALIMLVGIVHHVPEWITGLLGVVFIAASLWSSVRFNRAQRAVPHADA